MERGKTWSRYGLNIGNSMFDIHVSTHIESFDTISNTNANADMCVSPVHEFSLFGCDFFFFFSKCHVFHSFIKCHGAGVFFSKCHVFHNFIKCLGELFFFFLVFVLFFLLLFVGDFFFFVFLMCRRFLCTTDLSATLFRFVCCWCFP